MIKATDMVLAAPKYLGTPYNTMDCQAFVERCMKECGESTNLAGSNAWYRKIMKEGWVGTPKECKEKYGKVPEGAFLFILSQNGKEPAKYKPDGIGNASHIGLYTGLSGKQMVQMAKEEGNNIAGGFNYGNGAIHSSSTYGAVCTSNFSGKAIDGGWNMIGLWNKIDYGLGGTNEMTTDKKTLYRAQVIGGRLNLRQMPNSNAKPLCQIPDGEIIDIFSESGEWAETSYSGHEGWVMRSFLAPLVSETDSIAVSRKQLEFIYNELGDMLGLRG